VIRVAFICDCFELGGQELGCLAIMQRLDRSQFAPYLYTFRPGNLLKDAAALGIPIMIGYDKPVADQSWEDADDAARSEYRERLAQRLRSDSIDACIVYAWPDGIAAAREANLRAIIERVDGVALATRIADKSACDRIICEANSVRDLLLAQRRILRCRREQIVVIRNGIDLERFDPANYDRTQCRAELGFTRKDFVVGTVSRLAPEKNLEHLLQAIEIFAHRYARAKLGDVRAVIAGPDGGSQEHLQAEAARLGIADRMKFLAARTQVPELLRALDVFAITSFYEGAPFALLEAMAMGLPIVATQVGAVAELIDGNGFLVPLLHPAETAKAFCQLQTNPDLRCDLASRSRELGLRYDVNRMVREYETVVLDALQGESAHLSAAVSVREA
jgi:glycosyltransferase involved in cell wall biosynthesis